MSNPAQGRGRPLVLPKPCCPRPHTQGLREGGGGAPRSAVVLSAPGGPALAPGSPCGSGHPSPGWLPSGPGAPSPPGPSSWPPPSVGAGPGGSPLLAAAAAPAEAEPWWVSLGRWGCPILPFLCPTEDKPPLSQVASSSCRWEMALHPSQKPTPPFSRGDLAPRPCQPSDSGGRKLGPQIGGTHGAILGSTPLVRETLPYSWTPGILACALKVWLTHPR